MQFNAQSKNWAGTTANPAVSLEDFLELLKASGAACARVQEELAPSGLRHFQWCARWGSNQREKVVRKLFPGSHISVAKNMAQLWAYCGKEDTRVNGPLEFGDPPVARNTGGTRAERNAMLLAKGAE
jgi:hypothetical protein